MRVDHFSHATYWAELTGLSWSCSSAYFLVNLSLTLYNKLALQAFSYPWTLTALHTGSSWIGCQLAERTGLSPRTARAGYGYRESLLLLIFSTLYTVNIAVSNISLQMVSVPLHQVIRALTPFFSISISTILLGKSYSATIWISLCTILAGVGLATYAAQSGGSVAYVLTGQHIHSSGDYSASTAGVLMTLLGALLASLKGLSTNRILVGSLRMPPLQLLKRMSRRPLPRHPCTRGIAKLVLCLCSPRLHAMSRIGILFRRTARSPRKSIYTRHGFIEAVFARRPLF